MLDVFLTNKDVAFDRATRSWKADNLAWSGTSINKLIWQGADTSQLDAWNAKPGNAEIAEASRQRGHSLNAYCELLHKARNAGEALPEPCEGCEASLRKTDLFAESFNWRCDELFLAGQIAGEHCIGFADALWQMQSSEFILLDWKTKVSSKKFSLDWHCSLKHQQQLACYAMLAWQMYGIKVQTCIFAYCFEDGEPAMLKYMQTCDIWQALQAFALHRKTFH